MLRFLALSATASACLLFGGCASIVSGQNQSLSVTTKSSGTDVSGAKCSLLNDKGTWYVTSPGSVMVRRSFNDLTINCALDGTEPGIVVTKSSTKGMAFGNILFGGVIGAGVDISTGAAYDYPDIIIVDMGKTQTLAPKVPTPDQAKSNPSSIEARQNPFAAPAATSVATASAAPLPAPAAAASAPAAALQTK